MRIGIVTGADTQRFTEGSPQHRALAHHSLDGLTARSSSFPARAAHLNSAAGSRSCCSCASSVLLSAFLPASEHRAWPSLGDPLASALHLSAGQDSVRVGDPDCVGDAVPGCVRDDAQDCAHVRSGFAVDMTAPLTSQGSCAFATFELLGATGLACCYQQRFLRVSCPL